MRDEDEKCKGCGKVAITLCRTDTLKSTTIMMKTNKFQLIIIMCFACGIVAAQCPVHDTDDMIILKSQEQVDSLLIDFPNCTVLKNLEISLNRSDVGTPINNLEPLTQLTQIETELSIRRNIASNSLPDLENLNGLDNLKELGILTIIRTNKLKSLKELNQLAKLSELNVSEAPLLAEIGMNNIEVSHTLSLFKAPELTTIEGVTITDEMETLVILDVPKLELQNQL